VLGLRQNWRQFSLLVLVNAFVGAMVGLERSVLPVLASREFGLASASAALSFIATFGLTKAFTNLAAGSLVEHRGRRWTLIVGWLAALPVPVMILFAPTWSWIIAANIFLGVNQGLTWSTTVIMKIDLVGPRSRGLAMGFNESAGYLAVAAAALGSGILASHWGLRAGPSVIGMVVATIGLLLSVLFVRETREFARVEEGRGADERAPARPSLPRVLARSLWRDADLFSVSQAGLVNNLNDGLAWGLFPLLFLGAGLSLRDTSILAAVYPATWGLSQLGTGALSDRWGRKAFIVAGMVLQGIALASMTLWEGFGPWAGALVVLGVGTALVYPTLLAAVGDISPPAHRAATVSVYRLWRDLGYAAGALLAGVLADAIGISGAINAIATLTVLSGFLVLIRFNESHPVARRTTKTPVEPPFAGAQ
jgi:MFS family permease